jgi:hypothetical protein
MRLRESSFLNILKNILFKIYILKARNLSLDISVVRRKYFWVISRNNRQLSMP